MDEDINSLSLSTLLEKYVNNIGSKGKEIYADAFINKVKSGVKENITFFAFYPDRLLYTDNEGMSLIEYILAYELPCYSFFISSISSDINIVKKLIEYGKYDYSQATEKILFSELEPGKLMIEHMFEYGLISDRNIFVIQDHDEIIDLLKKYNRFDLMSELSEYQLFADFEDGKTVIEYLFENNRVDKRIIMRISDYLQVYELCRKYNKLDLLPYLSEDVLFEEIDNEKPIEVLFKNNLINKDVIKKIKDHPELYELCKKYNRLDLINFFNDSILEEKVSGKEETIFEELLSNNYNFDRKFGSLTLCKIAMQNGKYDLLKNIREKLALEKIEGDKTILEYLLEKGVDVDTSEFLNLESCKVLLKHNRFDLLAKCSFETLINNADLNDTYLDLVLEECKKDPSKVNISKKYILSYDNEKLAKIYLTIARHDMMEYIRELYSSRLLQKDSSGKRLIDIMLEKDKSLTIERIIPGLLNNLDFALYLRIKGIKTNGLILGKDGRVLSNEYIEKNNSKLDSIKLDERLEGKLEEFRKIMFSDGKSDAYLVQTVMRAYRYLLSVNHPYAVKELDNLMEIKKKNPDFSIKEDTSGSHYNGLEKVVFLQDEDFAGMHHEMGHALFDLLTDRKIPDEYGKIIEKLKNDSILLDKVYVFSINFHNIKQKISNLVDEEYLSDYEEKITPERKKEIEEFLKKTKEDKIKEYVSLGYTEEELNMLIGETLTYEEYIRQDKEIKKKKLVGTIIYNTYPGLIETSDIIDSIFSGKFFSNSLITKDGKKIKPCGGHGIQYYTARGLKIGFDETIANYSAIVKSRNSTRAIKYLRDLFGDEFVDLIVNYYEKNIVNASELKENESLSL